MTTRAKALRPQPWPWTGRARILIEHPDRETGLAYASTLRQTGYAVAVCPGPDAGEGCPLVGRDGCAIADGADLVFSGLGLERSETRDVVRALKTESPGTALVVEVAAGDAERWPGILEGCEVVVGPVAPQELPSVVGRALAGRGA